MEVYNEKKFRENLSRIRRKNRIYQKCFSSPEGQEVLADLISVFMGMYPKQIFDNDVNKTNHNLGQQSVVLYILSRCYKERLDILKQLKMEAMTSHLEHNREIQSDD